MSVHEYQDLEQQRGDLDLGDRLNVVGVDPGGTTGIALFTLVSGIVADWEAFEVTPDGAANWLGHSLPKLRGERTTVAVERFVITTSTGRMGRTDRYDAIELIGIARHFSRWYGHDFTLQSPGDANGAVSNKHLRDAGWWTAGTKGHAIDATRHVVLRMMNLGFAPPWV